MATKKRSLPVTRHHIKIDHYHLHYSTAGTGQGLPLVLIHGYGTSGHIWQYVLPYLAQHHRVYSVDLPGHGRSSHQGDWELRAMAPLLIRWLEELHLKEVVVVGHSMGGAIAIHLAATAPERVKRLVLVDAAGLPLQKGLPAMALRAIRSTFQKGNGRYPAALVRDALRPRLRLLWQGAHEILRSDFLAELATIQTPTLIIWGEHDALLPLTLGHALQEALPHARFITLPCGHRPMLAYPTQFSELVLQFISSSVEL